MEWKDSDEFRRRETTMASLQRPSCGIASECAVLGTNGQQRGSLLWEAGKVPRQLRGKTRWRLARPCLRNV
jgi:hypothetical protein